MSSKQLKKILLIIGGMVTLGLCASAFAVSGIGGVASNVTSNLGAVARLITAGAYVAGFGFAVGAIAKFKAHKDNPTQVPISTPIALLFVGVALIFAPSVFKTGGATLFGDSGSVAGVGGTSGASFTHFS